MKIRDILKWIGVSLVLVVLICWGIYRRQANKKEGISDPSPTTQIKFGVMQIITINKITPVEVQIFDGENQSNIVIGQMDENTPYAYHYNRGLPNEDKGVVPAYKDIAKLGFKPNLQRYGLVKVELSLPKDAPMESAQLYYIIKKKL
jgi:hypothetical protein